MPKKRRPPPSLDALPAEDDDGRTLAVVEASSGSRNKYKYDPDLRVLTLHKVLPLGTSFPYSFGFIPSTLGEDGDPLDVLLLMDEPAQPGTVVPCRLIGIIEAEQSDEDGTVRNDRLLGVAAESHRYGESRDIADISRSVLREIERFFAFYNSQRGKEFKVVGHGDRGAAERAVAKGRRRRRKKG